MEARTEVYELLDGSGFVFEENRYKGLADREFLPLGVRRAIARWAVNRGEASILQKHLGSMDAAELERLEWLEIREQEDALEETAAFKVAWGRLSDDERSRLSHIEPHLEHQHSWPIRIGEVVKLFSQISEEQLRDWDDEGLVKAYRQGNERWREYFKSQVMMALKVEELMQAGWSVRELKEELGLVEKRNAKTVDDLTKLLAERKALRLR